MTRVENILDNTVVVENRPQNQTVRSGAQGITEEGGRRDEGGAMGGGGLQERRPGDPATIGNTYMLGGTTGR